ncbi:hypothetical protein ACO0LO_24475 [Undibacterium sp. TJN25]|uniref:hypothetical protein n=1 Tax=Undibacterium sp. TJN25 TaxID=3413056 RepID=UPI003BF320B6
MASTIWAWFHAYRTSIDSSLESLKSLALERLLNAGVFFEPQFSDSIAVVLHQAISKHETSEVASIEPKLNLGTVAFLRHLKPQMGKVRAVARLCFFA